MINKIYCTIADKCIDVFGKNIKLIVILFLLNVTYMIHAYMVFETKINFYIVCICIFMCSLILLYEILFFSLLINKLPKIIKYTIIFLTGIIFLIDNFTLSIYHSVFNKSMFQLILDTNKYEALDYIKTNINLSNMIYILFALSLMVIGFKLIMITFNLIIKNKRLLRFSIIFCIIIGINSFFIAYKTKILELLPFGISIVRVGILIPQAFSEITEYRQVYSQLENNDVEITYNNSDIPYVIFILGESTQRWHMQIYGYDKNTTPNLQKRLDNGEIALFTDVVSSQTVTTLSMQRMFTFYRNDALGSWYNYINLFDILKSRGGGILLFGYLTKKLLAFMEMLHEPMLTVAI